MVQILNKNNNLKKVQVIRQPCMVKNTAKLNRTPIIRRSGTFSQMLNSEQVISEKNNKNTYFI